MTTTETTPKTPAEVPSPSASFGARLASYGSFIALALSVLGLDQLTKYWISRHPGMQIHDYWPYGGIEVIDGFFYLCYIGNEGAAWGMFRGSGWLLSIVAVLALAAVVYYRRSIGLHSIAKQLAFGALCGGIVGNLIDRVRLRYVVDFLDFHFPFSIPMILENGRWPAFNVADIGISCGVFMYLIITWIEERREHKRAKAEQQAT